jgi:hypothetical protein
LFYSTLYKTDEYASFDNETHDFTPAYKERNKKLKEYAKNNNFSELLDITYTDMLETMTPFVIKMIDLIENNPEKTDDWYYPNIKS